jgi:hypothetical protein
MATDIVYKTPNETISYDVDFTPLLAAADASLTGESVTAVDSSDAAAASVVGTATKAGLVLTAPLQAGTNGEDYLVKFKATGNSSARVREVVIEMRVRSKIQGAQ